MISLASLWVLVVAFAALLVLVLVTVAAGFAHRRRCWVLDIAAAVGFWTSLSRAFGTWTSLSPVPLGSNRQRRCHGHRTKGQGRRGVAEGGEEATMGGEEVAIVGWLYYESRPR